MPRDQMRPLLWDELTSPKIAAAANAGGIVIVPLGATEQHGPHLPLHVDTEGAFDVALRAARTLTEFPVVVFQPVRWGHSPMHQTFPGTISISWQTLGALVTEICRAIHSHGFRKIFLLNGHGGNIGLLRTLVIGLNEEGIDVATATYFELLSKGEVAELLTADDRVTHAGEFETATVLHLNPDLVDREQITPTLGEAGTAYHARRRFESVLIGRNFTGESSGGALGLATAATAEQGDRGLGRCAEVLVEFLRHWVATTPTR